MAEERPVAEEKKKRNRPSGLVYKTKPIEQRFFKHVTVNEKTGCHEWTGATLNGYGIFRREKGVVARAHRVALELAGVPLPDGDFVIHVCDNPSCVRPDHLAVGTPQD